MSEPGGFETTEELTHELLRQTYPDKTPDWIDEKTSAVVKNIKSAVPRRFHHPPPEPDAAPSQEADPPKTRRGFRRWAIAIASVAGVAAVVGLVIARHEPITKALTQESGLFTVAVIAVLALGSTIWMRVRERYEKVLSCRVRIDMPLGGEFDAGDKIDLTSPDDATTVPDPGMVAVRVKNLSGAIIEPQDYLEPLRLRFPDRRVRNVEITQSVPMELQDVVATHPGFQRKAHSIALPPVQLNPDDSYYVVAILSGTKPGKQYDVSTEGRIRRGWITPESTVRWIRRRTIAGGAVTAVASGVLVVALLLNNAHSLTPLPQGLTCVSGTLTVEGSSAFGPAANLAATSYHAYCPDSTITVLPTGSIEGLRRLHDAPPGDRTNRLALSDGKESLGFNELLRHPVAVVPFTFVVNDNAPITGLNSDQATKIFTGQVSTWNQITRNPGRSTDARVVVRADNSGTRLTLENHVLNNNTNAARPQATATSDDCEKRRPEAEHARAIVCERSTTSDVLNRVAAVPDAIGYADMGEAGRTPGARPVALDGRMADLAGIEHGYPFWTIEDVYSYGALTDGSLAKAFTDYLERYLLQVQSDAAKTHQQPDYYPCDADRVQELCATNNR